MPDSPYGFNCRQAGPIGLKVNGVPVSVPSGSMVSAAVARAGMDAFRRSVDGQPRGPLCGMGICLECSVTIDGHPHCRSCQILCRPGMEVRTPMQHRVFPLRFPGGQ